MSIFTAYRDYDIDISTRPPADGELVDHRTAHQDLDSIISRNRARLDEGLVVEALNDSQVDVEVKVVHTSKDDAVELAKQMLDGQEIEDISAVEVEHSYYSTLMVSTVRASVPGKRQYMRISKCRH